MSEHSPHEEVMAEAIEDPSRASSNNAKNAVETHLQELLQTLLDLSIIVYDFQPEGNRLVWNKINDIIAQYQSIDQLKDEISEYIPEEVINYVEQGRNPDIFTRAFIERAAGENQYTNGKIQAVSEFRDLLQSELLQSFPDLDLPSLNDNEGDSAIDKMIESSNRLPSSNDKGERLADATFPEHQQSQSDAVTNELAKGYSNDNDNDNADSDEVMIV